MVSGRPPGRAPAASELLPFEVGNVLRRLEERRGMPPEVTSLAHLDLLRLDGTLWPYPAVADEAWLQRGRLSIYDASGFAIAQRLEVPPLTLDELPACSARALCTVRTPESSA